jgi:hypothetical protein
MAGYNHYVLCLPEGPATIHWPMMLSVESRNELRDWLDIIKRKVARSD